MVIDRIEAVRNAVGDDVDIIMENHSYLDAQPAVQLGRLVEKFNIFMYEEPTTPSPSLNEYVSNNINIPTTIQASKKCLNT